jgi:hypothetical protein
MKKPKLKKVKSKRKPKAPIFGDVFTKKPRK